MKLIRCYIENFGGLQQYTADFTDGLTVIHEANGFGKTTLAEFIRAMFYGFPRAAKDIQKNPRMKYLPWQGGRYGGYLIFEVNGKRYRIDRTFGEQPRQDRGKLFDESTHRETRDFSVDTLGIDLFGMDSDSFLRSTYMPQTRTGGPLSTDTIRAKLGNLLEDSGDLASYEKAVQRLKEKRTAYEHYRGTGGSIHETQKQITALQNQLLTCRTMQPQLEQITDDITALKQEQQLGEQALQHLRTQLTQANTALAEAALSREYESLLARKQTTDDRLAALRKRYPEGLPTRTELDAAGQAMDDIAVLKNSLQETPADRSAAETAASLQDTFSNGIPTQEQLQTHRDTCNRLVTTHSRLQNTALSQSDTQTLQALSLQFAKGVPKDALLDDCDRKAAEVTRLKHLAQTQQLPEEERSKLDSLHRFFAAGVPTAEQTDYHHKQLETADRIRQDNLRLAAALPEEEEAVPVKKLHGGFLPLLLLGILAVAAGICLLTMHALPPQLAAYSAVLVPILANRMLIGGCSCGIAVIALIVCLFLQLKHSLKVELAGSSAAMTAAQRNLIAENEGKAAALEEETAAFLNRYPLDHSRSLQRQLSDLETTLAMYLSLRERSQKLQDAQRETAAAITRLTDTLQTRLAPWVTQFFSIDTALQLLRSRKEQYLKLQAQQAALTEQAQQLQTIIATAEEQVAAFLLPYCGTVAPEQFRQTLDELQRKADRYTAARTHMQQRTLQLQQRDDKLAQLQSTLDRFCSSYGLQLEDRRSLKTIERDAEQTTELEQAAVSAAQALEQFLAEHGPKPASALPETHLDPEALKAGEQEQLRKQRDRNTRLAQLEQRRRLLQTEVDRIPELTDELTRRTEQKSVDTERRHLLDETIDFLQKARESLSHSYLGGVQGHFTKYLHRLTGEAENSIAVNTDLEVQLERAGSARPLSYFSAGQSDLVQLCMRLALSDALFEGDPCFMILDDPFVNLDDDHTHQALELLRELAEDRQIIYLVCNSSRI